MTCAAPLDRGTPLEDALARTDVAEAARDEARVEEVPTGAPPTAEVVRAVEVLGRAVEVPAAAVLLADERD